MSSSKKSIHFIGIGGIGMSGIARMYLSLGHAVRGSDVKYSEVLNELEHMGARVLIGHDPANVQGADLVVYSSSIKENHPERVAAAQMGLKIIHRADALAALCAGKYTIAVAGTHGKTTTTALVGVILREAMRDPSVVVGGVVDLLGGNACVGNGREIVIEADESDASFLKFNPDLEIITNVEKEHLDHYGTLGQMEEAFTEFIRRLKSSGEWIGCGEDAKVLELARASASPVTLYGFDPSVCDYYATDIQECPDGRRGFSFTAWHGKKKLGVVELKIIGLHNVLNSLAAIIVSQKLGIDFAVVQKALARYVGAGRRFDVQYEDGDYLIVDDYAHHPTEIEKTIAAARSIGRGRVFVAFQPHRYTRTRELMNEFSRAFAGADKIFITDIYAAGEAPIPSVTGEIVASLVRESGCAQTQYVGRREVFEEARNQIKPGDLFIAMGAGDINQVALELAAHLRRKSGKLQAFEEIRGKVLKEEPLSRHTSLKIGGPAEYWIEPADLDDLRRVIAIAVENSIPLRVFGAGSNILASDQGVRGVVIHLGSSYFRQLTDGGDGRITARGGVMNTLFIQFALERGLGGFEFLSGIPGNIGGAVMMNAGSHGQSVDHYLEEARFLGFDGVLRTIKKEDIPFRYRSCGIENAVLVEAVFRFAEADRGQTQKKLDEFREHRSKTQDLWHASAGCMFKNPEAPGCFSGKMIDEAGLKGWTVGKAQVSDKHGNFIINLGGATAADVRELIFRVQGKVYDRFGIRLQTEVKYMRDSKVAVLAGGPSCEREVSLVSGQAVSQALSRKGYRVLMVDPDVQGRFVEKIKSENIDIVFIALHGSFGEDGTVQRLLESAGLVYTGPGPQASEIAFDKSRTQALLKEAGIRIPPFKVVQDASQACEWTSQDFPLVVKPCKAGSSVGVSAVREPSALPAAIREALKYSETAIVERFIVGRELTVSVLDGKALPIVEIVAEKGFYDYEAKYHSRSTRYEVPAKLSSQEARAVSDAALAAYRVLGCEVMSRVDILWEDGKPYVLEVNTIPGFTDKSLLPKAALASGVCFDDLCVKILELSRSRMRNGVPW